jgi:hypothetical protein
MLYQHQKIQPKTKFLYISENLNPKLDVILAKKPNPKLDIISTKNPHLELDVNMSTKESKHKTRC